MGNFLYCSVVTDSVVSTTLLGLSGKYAAQTTKPFILLECLQENDLE
jgi:hypothetical protein